MGIVIGMDEVGRGCWAGPLVAGAVALPATIAGLNDSKLLSKLQRESLAEQIHALAHVGLGWVSSSEVDDLGLTKAVALAMRRALDELQKLGNEVIESILIDGNFNFLPELTNTRAIIGGDKLEQAISAASIVAKVARDAYMAELALQHPGYGFESHVGYGTAQHKLALEKFGVLSHHRKSYKPIQAFL